MKRLTCLQNNNIFTASLRATYSAFDVKKSNVLENQQLHTPPHTIAPLDTYRLPVALLGS